LKTSASHTEASGQKGISRFSQEAAASMLLLTGKPGTGKTAIIREALARTGTKAGGFYTEEIRARGIRQGFKIITIGGQEAVLAHVNISSPYRVSKYKVDIDNLNRLGVSALRQALEKADLIVVDEIGKMEIISPQFRESVRQATESGKRVLGTIMLNADPFADEVKRHSGVRTLTVTGVNNREVLEEVLQWLKCGA
jgi:nucleoside-triphosphatase